MTPSQKIKKRVLQELYSPGRVTEARLENTVYIRKCSHLKALEIESDTYRIVLPNLHF